MSPGDYGSRGPRVVYDPAAEGLQVERSGQVLELDSPERGVGFPQSVESLGRLHPDPGSILHGDFVSAAALIQKAKQFDDGFYAAVELAALHGHHERRAKTEWLGALRAALGHDEAAVPLYAAAGMLDSGACVPEPLAEAVGRCTEAFLKCARRSKPISFYTWSPELASVFRHDRMLQDELEAPRLDSWVRALRAEPEIREEYESYLRFIEQLTNPLADDGLRRALHALDRGLEPALDRAPLIPPSVSHETRLVRMLYGEEPIPDDFDLMTELIERVRSGSVDLRPTAESGWYDHQLWSLEPMANPEKMPEADHLAFTPDYRSHLEDLLKSTWALARETHAKQVELPMAGMAQPPQPARPQLFVRPELSCEPLVSHYRRRADAYRFVRDVTVRFFGADALGSMHRLTIDGPVAANLADELTFMERLFDGAADRCEREIGMRTDAAGADRDPFASWDPQLDPDLSGDVRMMVPVFFDVERRKTRVWAVLGWAERQLRVSFREKPALVIRDAAGVDVTSDYDVDFTAEWHRMAFPEVAEIYVDRILDRDEFRALCDERGTREAILAAL